MATGLRPRAPFSGPRTRASRILQSSRHLQHKRSLVQLPWSVRSPGLHRGLLQFLPPCAGCFAAIQSPLFRVVARVALGWEVGSAGPALNYMQQHEGRIRPAAILSPERQQNSRMRPQEYTKGRIRGGICCLGGTCIGPLNVG